MPLHLLGKKSWNVYNPDNIARVRRDEAQARAREEEAERRMQEEDAERRIQILRGQRTSTPPPPVPPPSSEHRNYRPSRRDEVERHTRRRRLAGEDDTDRDIRFALEDAARAHAKREELVLSHKTHASDAPLVDIAGHINLFPAENAQRQRAEKNSEAEAESAKMNRQHEDHYLMRFSNATGNNHAIGRSPWYSSIADAGKAPEPMSEKDVWGEEDPLRREREKARLDANDPLAAMKKGVRQLRAVENERTRWNEERKQEFDHTEIGVRRRPGRHESPTHSRLFDSSDNGLEGFTLDSSSHRHKDAGDRISRRHRHRQHNDKSIQSPHKKHHERSQPYHHHHRHHPRSTDNDRELYRRSNSHRSIGNQ